ncbi:MAG TPA: methyltransferase domain-containing protein [Gemmataceae bacterium]|nr:methyltransferase domain-containing protein [Gemmataceae bacterium]
MLSERVRQSGEGQIGEPEQGVPDYAPALATTHTAFCDELASAIAQLPLRQGDRVLDVPCGDGFYSALLAQRVGPQGTVVAADHSSDYLEWAKRLTQPASRTHVELAAADAYHLPFADDSFDLVWCAQSLISLDAVPALRELHRLVRPGGTVALLETDDGYHVLLPWPVGLELALQRGLYRACRQRYGNGVKLYPGRRLRRLLGRAGLEPVRSTTYAVSRHAPLGSEDRAFFVDFFRYLRELAWPDLRPAARRRFETLTDPGSRHCLLNRPDFEATYLFMITLGTKRRHRERTS